MSKPSRAEPDEEAAGKMLQAERVSLAIIKSVLRELGEPGDLFRVAVIWLWENNYRVNVRTGLDAVSAHIAHNFIVQVDEAGAVLTSVPALRRAY